MNIKITQTNPIYCQAQGKEAIEAILPCLSYEKESGYRGAYSWKKTISKKTLISKAGHFLAGLKSRVQQYSLRNNISIQWSSSVNPLPFAPPHLRSITLRPDQIPLICKAATIQRGMIKAPTGIGKTIMAGGVLSCFQGLRSLFFVNEKTLFEQNYQELVKQGFRVGRFDADSKDLHHNVTVAMVQSFAKLGDHILDYFGDVDIIIVDEADIGTNKNSMLFKILTNLLAPVRIGFSATLPQQKESQLFLEGLLGPVIGEMTTQEGVKLGLLAKPRLHFVPTEYNSDIHDIRSYKEAYDQGIIHNRSDHRLILMTALEYLNKGKSVLIFVSSVDHGKNLSELAKKLDLDIPFIWGSTEAKDRMAAKNQLQTKELRCAVANKVWCRGVNIPSLDVIINAGRGKGDTLTEQKDGRGLRVFEDKKEMTIVEFVDVSNRHLSSHLAFRLNFYVKKGWI